VRGAGGKALELARRPAWCSPATLAVAAAARGGERAPARRDNCTRSSATHGAVVTPSSGARRAPCTAPAPSAVTRRALAVKASDLAVMPALQRDILRRRLRGGAGGLLVYATCSLEPRRTTRRWTTSRAHAGEWTLEAPPPGAVPAAVLDAGRLRVLPQRHSVPDAPVDGAFAGAAASRG
jgi:hypothetical protein